MSKDKIKVFNDVYMEKFISIKEEFDITTITIYNKDRTTLGSIIILKKEWDKIFDRKRK